MVDIVHLTIPRRIIGPRDGLLLFNLEELGIHMPTPTSLMLH